MKMNVHNTTCKINQSFKKVKEKIKATANILKSLG